MAERKVIVGCQDGRLYAFDLADGHMVWTIPGESPVNGSPAYREGRVVVGTDDGTVLGVDVGLGRIVWRVATGGGVKSRPAFLDRIVWVTGYDGFLHGIEWLTGAEAVKVALDSAAYSSPAIQDGVAYFGVMDGRFLAVAWGSRPANLSAPRTFASVCGLGGRDEAPRPLFRQETTGPMLDTIKQTVMKTLERVFGTKYERDMRRLGPHRARDQRALRELQVALRR